MKAGLYANRQYRHGVASPIAPDANTFMFADIAGYTALTEAHGDEDAAELARTFCRAVAGVASEEGGELVKTIGDAVMIRHPDPARAISLGLRAAGEVLAGHGFPTVRVGMHHGPALESEGDWFGSTVNLAARVAALAAGGEVLLTAAVREAAGELEGVRLESRGEQRLRNVPAPVAVFAATLEGREAAHRDVDPVCRMVVAEGREVGTVRHRGADYRFCSLGCIRLFAEAPDAYVD
jgi:class 3 adenylate cyclase/YHS domain-containing protein